MRRVILLLILCHAASAVRHSLQYFYTASSGIPDFPEFVSLGMLDGVQMVYYDSNIRKVIPKQDWMAENEGPEYWESETQKFIGSEQIFKVNIETAKSRFSQTGGVHIAQRMFGCEWDNETEEVSGYYQDSYDGDDFVSFDLKTETWIAPKPQAFITKLKWDNNKASIAQWKNYLTQVCPEWLKKYVDYGRSSLLRTALPSVSLLQKTPSSPVSCHATGFYPDRAMMFWRKDGEELHEDVDRGEILPNHDGTFQMRADLKVSSIPSKDWRRYDCVFQLSGVKEDIITKLDKAEIRTNRETSSDVTVFIIAAVVVVSLVLIIIIVIGFVVYKTKKGKSEKSTQQKSKTSSCSSDDSAKESDKALIKEPNTFSHNSDSSSGESVDSTTSLIKESKTSSCSSDDSAKESDKALIKDPDTFSHNSDSSSGESVDSTTSLIKDERHNLKRRVNSTL